MADIDVLVTGGSGLLGRAIMEELRQASLLVVGLAFSRADPEKQLRRVDLTDDAQVREVVEELHPKVIVHCAAERRPDVCEGDEKATQSINGGLLDYPPFTSPPFSFSSSSSYSPQI